MKQSNSELEIIDNLNGKAVLLVCYALGTEGGRSIRSPFFPLL
jgi:hypothetical protein